MKLLLIILLATPAFASGAVVELGAGAVAFPATPAIDTALGLHFDFAHGGALEVRARGGPRLNLPSARLEGFITGTVHYVTSRIPICELGLTFGFGAGVAYFSGCLGSDVCAPLGAGPIIELTHRLLFPSAVARFFVAANLSCALLPRAVVPFALSGSLGVGWLFDLGPGPSWRQKERNGIPRTKP